MGRRQNGRGAGCWQRRARYRYPEHRYCRAHVDAQMAPTAQKETAGWNYPGSDCAPRHVTTFGSTAVGLMFLLRRFSVKMSRAARPRHGSEHTRTLQNTAPAFRSAWTTVRSALASLLISQSPSPVPCPVPPGFNRPLVIPTLAMHVDMTRRRALLSMISPMGLPRLATGFWGARFQSPSLTSSTLHHALTN